MDEEKQESEEEMELETSQDIMANEEKQESEEEMEIDFSKMKSPVTLQELMAKEEKQESSEEEMGIDFSKLKSPATLEDLMVMAKEGKQESEEEMKIDFSKLKSPATLEDLLAKEDKKNDQIINDQTGDKYVAMQPIGVASGVTVYSGTFHPEDPDVYETMRIHDAFVTLKIVNLDQQEEYNRLNQEVQRSRLIAEHDNILGIRDSFIREKRFFVVMPCMDRGSLRSIMSSQFPYGLPEECIAVALRESIIGLSHLHGNGHVHKDINAGHIFLYRKPAVQLAFAATIYEHNGNDQASSSSVMPATTICTWAAAPEVYNSQNEYTPKADIWLIGITALELGYGGLRIANRAALEVMIEEIIEKNRLPKKYEGKTNKVKGKNKKLVDRGKEKGKKLVNLGKRLVSGEWKKRTFSKAFEEMVVMCLAWDAAKRPTTDQLLQNKFFRKAKDVSYFDKVIEGRI